MKKNSHFETQIEEIKQKPFSQTVTEQPKTAAAAASAAAATAAAATTTTAADQAGRTNGRPTTRRRYFHITGYKSTVIWPSTTTSSNTIRQTTRTAEPTACIKIQADGGWNFPDEIDDQFCIL
ncbi:putative leucine-rich repeat-containing protein-like protein [Trichinella spiralis]|uniref:putative leucine-rich repeat-containing protein-like protein n=1 Tax=Trichinella spiralis TaxID=6334 RepID=UPI0001EFECAD|nr:putative leucine-rich repeat-containing protein-like protein [Trichinella spiralis]